MPKNIRFKLACKISNASTTFESYINKSDSFMKTKQLQMNKLKDAFFSVKISKTPVFDDIQSTSAILSTCCLKLLLCRTFCLICSAFSLTSIFNPSGISNSTILNFHYIEQFSRHLNVNNCITALMKLCSKFSFFFQHCLDNNMPLVKKKLRKSGNVRREMSGFESPRKKSLHQRHR